MRRLVLWAAAGAVLGAVGAGPAGAQGLTAGEYQSLRQVWKLGYVVGLAHGRRLYRHGAADPREAAMDACIPGLSDVEIVRAVAAHLAAEPAAAGRPAAAVVLDAIAAHCMK